jgi:hypothetical protein
MSEFKVGDEVLIHSAKLAGITDFFEGKVVRIVMIVDDRYIINSEEFKYPYGTGQSWGHGGYVLKKGICKPTKLHKALA